MLDSQCSDHGWRTLYCVHCGSTHQIIVDCGHRFCPFCGRRRAARVRDRLNHLLKCSKQIPKARIKMLTLSVKNCADLDAGITHLIKSFRRLRQRKDWKRYVFGGAFVIEIKGRPGDWHPHIHAIIHSYYFPWSLLRSAWQAVSSGTAVWICDITDDNAKRYVTKYITKPQIDPAHLDYVNRSLRRFRLFNRFGDWHNILLPKHHYDAPCKECGHIDWVVDFKIWHGHWRDIPAGELIPEVSASSVLSLERKNQRNFGLRNGTAALEPPPQNTLL